MLNHDSSPLLTIITTHHSPTFQPFSTSAIHSQSVWAGPSVKTCASETQQGFPSDHQILMPGSEELSQLGLPTRATGKRFGATRSGRPNAAVDTMEMRMELLLVVDHNTR